MFQLFAMFPSKQKQKTETIQLKADFMSPSVYTSRLNSQIKKQVGRENKLTHN